MTGTKLAGSIVSDVGDVVGLVDPIVNRILHPFRGDLCFEHIEASKEWVFPYEIGLPNATVANGRTGTEH
jgi:hypothetical protein